MIKTNNTSNGQKRNKQTMVEKCNVQHRYSNAIKPLILKLCVTMCLLTCLNCFNYVGNVISGWRRAGIFCCSLGLWGVSQTDVRTVAEPFSTSKWVKTKWVSVWGCCFYKSGDAVFSQVGLFVLCNATDDTNSYTMSLVKDPKPNEITTAFFNCVWVHKHEGTFWLIA